MSSEGPIIVENVATDACLFETWKHHANKRVERLVKWGIRVTLLCALPAGPTPALAPFLHI